MSEIRTTFRRRLDELEESALGGLDLVGEALKRTLEALERHDVELACQVIADDDRIDGRYLEVHQSALSLLALQAPVAGDLRLIAALLHVIRCIERMGDQCVNIAKMIPLSGHQPPADAAIEAYLLEMGTLVGDEIIQARRAFAERNTGLAQDLVERDAEVNRINREIFHRALAIGDDHDTREWAMHAILIARALERIGDNTVDIGEQIAFVTTGLFREFGDASHPAVS